MISALFGMSVRGGVMIAVIALLRWALQHRVRRGVWLAAWAIAVLRLLVPFSVASPASVYNLLRRPPAQAVSVAPVLGQSAAVSSVPAPVPRGPGLLMLLWLSGALMLALVFLGLHLRSLRDYRFSVPCETAIRLPPRVRVRRLEGLRAPLTYGLFRPVILLSADLTEDSPDFTHILLHELSHIRHRDVAWKLLILLTLAVHWFNPLVWGMAWLVSQDLEMRCDADAVRALGDGARKAYAWTLIHAEEQKASGFLQPGFAHSGTAGRIRALAKGRVSAAFSMGLSVALPALLILCFATDRALASPPQIPAAPAPAVEAASIPVPAAVPAPEPAETIPPAPLSVSEPTPEPAPAVAYAQEPARDIAREPVFEPTPEQAPIPEPESIPEPEPAPEAEPIPEPEPAQAVEVKDPVILPVELYAPGAMTMAEGEAQTVPIGTGWVELYCDNPGVLELSGVSNAGDVFFSTFTAVRAGSANVYCSRDGAWQLFAAVTVSP